MAQRVPTVASGSRTLMDPRLPRLVKQGGCRCLRFV